MAISGDGRKLQKFIYSKIKEIDPKAYDIQTTALEIPISMIQKFINAELKELSNQ